MPDQSPNPQTGEAVAAWLETNVRSVWHQPGSESGPIIDYENLTRDLLESTGLASTLEAADKLATGTRAALEALDDPNRSLTSVKMILDHVLLAWDRTKRQNNDTSRLREV